MPKANATGGKAAAQPAAGANQDVDTDDTLNDQDADVDTDDTDNDQDADQDSDDQDAKLPKTQAELNKMLKNRLERQKKTLEKKHQADLKKANDLKEKSEVEVEKQKSADLVGKITDKNFLIAVKDAGATPAGADKLLKLFRGDIEADDDGEISNIEDLLDSAKNDFGELFKASGKGSGDGGSGGGGKPKDEAKIWNDQIKKDLGY